MIEIKEEMNKIVINMRLPSQIHYIIKQLYADYQNSYKKVIEYLKKQYPYKVQEIARLDEITLEDYREDMHMVQTIEFEEYEQRRAIIVETIHTILRCVNARKDIPKEIFENNMKETAKENERFTKIVMDNAISEMISSSKYFINKINYFDLRIDGEVENQFLEEIKSIKENATQKSTEINKIITEHLENIYEQLESIVETYKNEIQERKIENTILRTINDDNER